MSMRTTPQTLIGLSTAGLMDRYLHNQPDKTTSGEPAKIAKAAFMKNVQLFRTRKGKVVAAIPRSPIHLELLNCSGRTIYTLGGAASFSMWPANSVYVFRGDMCSLAIVGECKMSGACDEPEIAQSFNTQAVFAAERGQVLVAKDEYRSPPRSHTSSSGRTTPELCWSPTLTASSTDELEEIKVDEIELEAIFHQLIDVTQCECS
ncbi:hypothetical protein BDY19DRAFT_54136 [Irpex rosettiformis]|uniref:Uncharacterized protein n=1 Tax=Irpex rosettiformis TaxID=378272 RepID=A0ACB8UL97_9APHY|nr:hypothetical protein BDY19DRAFT_54136 [Irpex rosettiformis]